MWSRAEWHLSSRVCSDDHFCNESERKHLLMWWKPRKLKPERKYVKWTKFILLFNHSEISLWQMTIWKNERPNVEKRGHLSAASHYPLPHFVLALVCFHWFISCHFHTVTEEHTAQCCSAFHINLLFITHRLRSVHLHSQRLTQL